MIKVIDIDKLFDEYISDFVYKNIGKMKPEDIENKIPELYLKFGDEKLKELDNKSPVEYYLQFSIDKLLTCLKSHLEQKIDVPDFLCEAINSDINNEDELVKALDDDNEEFMLYAMNMLIDLQSKNCLTKFLELILWDYSEPIKELATEYLRENADKVKQEILNQFNECEIDVKEYMTEILSGCNNDDKVFDILIEQFVKNEDKTPIYSGYLAKFGDERAIPFLMERIEREDISYADFEELRFAIETLGGEYNKIRDFKKDKSYQKIKQVSNKKN